MFSIARSPTSRRKPSKSSSPTPLGATWNSRGVGRITKLTRPDGRERTYRYNRAGDLIATTDYDGFLWRYFYLDHDLIRAVDPEGNVAFDARYDEAGELTSISSASGATSTFGVDRAGQTHRTVDDFGQTSVLRYNAAGQITESISPQGTEHVAYNAAGGNGCISVTANVAPALCAAMQTACRDGDFKQAMNIQDRLMPLHLALFAEPNPAGAKYAASLLGHCDAFCRLPMVPLSGESKSAIQSAMTGLGLI